MMKKEDLMANGKIDTTIEGIDMYAADWVEQAAEKVGAVEGDTYVKLNRGILTVTQIDALLDSIPLEFSYIDANNQFIYYNNEKPADEMTAPSYPESVGNPLGTLHPEKITQMVQMMIAQLRAGNKDHFRIGHPTADGEKFVTHNYQRIQDKDGSYLGVNEYVMDLKPLVDYYLEQTGQKLVPDEEAASEKPDIAKMAMDALSGASEKSSAVHNTEADAVSHASAKY